jgi:putative heme-binding domain-containing protein
MWRSPVCRIAKSFGVALLLFAEPRLHAQRAPERRPADVVEIVPTARTEPQTWRYTLDKPADDWNSAQFDDAGWKSGRGGFGSAGTPGVVVNTEWSTRDIWLRRTVDLPAKGFLPSELQLLAFYDEDVEIYLDGVLAARRGGFITEYQSIEILPDVRRLLKPGAKLVMAVHCRQNSGGQGIDVGLATVSARWLADRRRDAYRGFALSHTGDAAAGRELFLNTQRLACARCHTNDGAAGRAGPDLHAIGDKFTRGELADAVLRPSANIAVGYSTTIITTKSGDAFVGIVKEAADDHLGLMDGSGKLQRIETADIAKRGTQSTSLMPDELEAGLSQAEFANLIEYLVSLRLPELADAGRQGMPAKIDELNPPVGLVPIHTPENHFEHPCWMGQIPAEAGTFLICEHETGRVWRLTTGAGGETKTLWGDFRNEIRPGGAIGLLGLAFHPKFRENRKYYIQHQQLINGRIVARVSEKLASEDLKRDSGQPSRTIIEFACSTDVHSGGGITFGPDGMLYIGMGDTGPMGDPEGHAQNLKSPLGKMLRIDVDHPDAGQAYGIPADNPLRSRDGARPEIWAYGFRELWRFSFDSDTGDLWVGDVGQDRIEEVDIVHPGENFGWNVYEGFDLFSTRYRAASPTTTPAYVPPIFAYNRRFGNSITGGYVYRAAKDSPFYGTYICGDFTSKRVWGLKQGDRKLTSIAQVCTSPEEIASFGRDDAGTLYLVGYQGTIFRLDFAAARPADQ